MNNVLPSYNTTYSTYNLLLYARVLPEQSTYRLRVALRTLQLLFMFIGWAMILQLILLPSYKYNIIGLFIKTIRATVCIFVEYLRS